MARFWLRRSATPLSQNWTSGDKLIHTSFPWNAMYTPSLVRPKGGNQTPKLKYWSKILARIAVRSVRAGKVAHYRTTQHQPKQIKEPNLPSNNLPSNKSPACDNQTAQATLPSRHTISPPEPKRQARKNNNVTTSQNRHLHVLPPTQTTHQRSHPPTQPLPQDSTRQTHHCPGLQTVQRRLSKRRRLLLAQHQPPRTTPRRSLARHGRGTTSTPTPQPTSSHGSATSTPGQHRTHPGLHDHGPLRRHQTRVQHRPRPTQQDSQPHHHRPLLPHHQKRLQPPYTAKSRALDGFTTDDNHDLQTLLSIVNAQPITTIGDIFAYQYHLLTDDLQASIWLLTFYQTTTFIGTTLKQQDHTW